MTTDLTDRVERLEIQLAEIVSGRPAVATGPVDGGAPGRTDRSADGLRPGPEPGAAHGPDAEVFWALTELRHRLPDPGGVLFTGAVTLPTGEHLEWQEARETAGLLATDWSAAANVLGALAHPVRLMVLRAALAGIRNTAELADLEGIGTPGQLHHHLRPLLAAGWLRTAGRGLYEVPPTRVVPLLTILAAAGAS